ncbi:flagellar hook-length control protein FliK [Paenibacillus larvae subsp. larvae]|uniref:Flagellar hook-length control protein FliK n=1 Tax=Paenibacillus larvae subsp. larvae TaxID=147375 RepID=A0A2L1U1S9_9BACL|nr:flagellar hook-length control protein FliK [Paenibacillus larvae]AQZ48781.1 hypothetical protein B5S25_21585 [Paenibacillus larvae subsp. pulvifaciens]AVF26876.1 flagellar hook-length control protein FliK [Paenibacillus larvae subsp. larvae]AVF31627.1 flagellar hook-length control protein FliK [Paenibacillus larvae subsp. larvae]MCY7518517.1 flagellar hook-length control protein FliK [Paenibacillus larvae]MCY9500371.1 flagellar hook-length control protein FliK [Paenibacillus larvae]
MDMMNALTALVSGGSLPKDLSGKTGGAGDKAGGTSFSDLLGGQPDNLMKEEKTDEGGLPAAFLLSILPLQTASIEEAGAGQHVDGQLQIPEILLGLLNQNEEVASKLLQNPDFQAWIQETADVLNSWNGQEAEMTRPVDLLEAQQVLLDLMTLQHTQSGNPVIRHLADELAAVVQPVLATFAEEDQRAGNPLNISDLGTEPDVQKGAITPTASRKPDNVPAKPDSMTGAENVEIKVQTISEKQPATQLQANKALEMMAAKSGYGTALQQPVEETGSLLAKNAPQESAEPVLQQTLQDPFKALGQTETAETEQLAMNAKRFAEEMSTHLLKNQMKFMMKEGVSEAKLTLYPRQLGHVEVKILMHQGQLVAQFVAETMAGKDALESQLVQLRQTLQQQGIQVQKLEVTHNSEASGMFQDNRQQQGSKQSYSQQKTRTFFGEELLTASEEIELREELRRATYGNAFGASV